MQEDMRMQTTADTLFQYLKDILYAPDRAELSPEELPPEFHKLGTGMVLLGQWMNEARSFGKELSRGDFSVDPPDVRNVVAAPLKEIQGVFRHLAWQTQQVAKGDYSQRVDFMGDFSESFNTMVCQLDERQKEILQEKELVEKKNAELQRNLELVMALTNLTHNLIFVCSLKNHKPLFFNDSAQWFFKTRPSALRRVFKEIAGREREIIEHTTVWDIEIPGNHSDDQGEIRYFSVESYHIMWSGEMAVVSIMIDDTERRRKENLMYKLAYADPLTGLNNRRYAMDTMKLLMENGVSFVMSFVDVDYLKLCNDTLGHKAGDDYLIEIANALRTLGGEVCRVGGDEFIIIQKDRSLKTQDEQLESLRTMIIKNGELRDHPRSFSYASCIVPAYTNKKLDDFIQIADSMMYDYKLAHKKAVKTQLDKKEG